jgi:alkaline phosphatase D
MRYSRRDILKLAAASPVLGLLTQVGCGDGEDGATAGDGFPIYEYSGAPGPQDLFQHGVASGDPLPRAVMLWTRATPASDEPVEVFWEIARDAAFEQRAGAGWVTASAERDFTVKLDAVSLEPDTSYYYRFRALDRSSPVGRTRTAPASSADSVRFAIVSCASLGHGYFHGYRALAARDDIDVVLHLGDYIYEYGSGEYGDVRPYEPPHEIITLSDYRMRYAQYRRDADLQALHGQVPFIAVWDDHEAADNSFAAGAVNHSEGPEGRWSERVQIARRVFSEWMPIRDQPDGRIFRTFEFGDLLDLLMLDTRLWGRDRPAAGNQDIAVINDPNRTMLGFDQEGWLEEQLRASTARWRVIGQQVVFGHIKAAGAPNSEGGGVILNPDQWDGYAAARQRVFDLIRDADLHNVVVLSGDIHSSGCGDLNDDPNNPDAYDPETGAGSLAVELVTPAITSPSLGPGANDSIRPLLLAANPHIKYVDVERRGYLIVEITHERVRGEWHHYAAVESPHAEEQPVGPVFVCLDGSDRLIEESALALRRDSRSGDRQVAVA